MSARLITPALVSALLATACIGGDGPEATSEASDDIVPISVTVPAERQSPFCEAMIDLADRVNGGEVDDVEAEIIETYREIRPEVPAVIAADFDAVLTALETGAPPPTDPTTPPTSSTIPTTSNEASTSVVGSVDEGFDPTTSPAERINDHVAFTCRNSKNNPGPPPTEPGVVVD